MKCAYKPEPYAFESIAKTNNRLQTEGKTNKVHSYAPIIACFHQYTHWQRQRVRERERGKRGKNRNLFEWNPTTEQPIYRPKQTFYCLSFYLVRLPNYMENAVLVWHANWKCKLEYRECVCFDSILSSSSSFDSILYSCRFVLLLFLFLFLFFRDFFSFIRVYICLHADYSLGIALCFMYTLKWKKYDPNYFLIAFCLSTLRFDLLQWLRVNELNLLSRNSLDLKNDYGRSEIQSPMFHVVVRIFCILAKKIGLRN